MVLLMLLAVVGAIAVTWVLNRTFLEDYYLYSKMDMLDEVFRTVENVIAEAEEEAKTAELGSWAEYFGEEFSGKAVYTASFEADDKFLDGEIYELDLGMVEYTADVIINGKFAGIASLTPHKLRFDGSFLQQHNTIEITVANTACNRTTTADVYSHLHQRDIGPYHQIEVMFERESLGGGLFVLQILILC